SANRLASASRNVLAEGPEKYFLKGIRSPRGAFRPGRLTCPPSSTSGEIGTSSGGAGNAARPCRSSSARSRSARPPGRRPRVSARPRPTAGRAQRGPEGRQQHEPRQPRDERRVPAVAVARQADGDHAQEQGVEEAQTAQADRKQHTPSRTHVWPP